MKNSNKDLIISCIEVNADEVLTGLRNRLVSYDDIRNNNDIELIDSYLIAKSWFLSQIKLKKETLKEECTVDYEFNYDEFICYATLEVLSLEEKPGTNKTDPNFRTETNTFYQIKYTKMSNLRIDEHRGTGKDAKYPNAKFCIEDVFDSKGTDVENFIEDFELWDKINELVLEQIEKERAQNGN